MSILRRVRNLVAAHLQRHAPPPADPERALEGLMHQAQALFTEFQVSYNAAVADQLAARQRLGAARAEADRWEEYAAQALRQGREDIARQALVSKQTALARVPELQQACTDLDAAAATLQQTGQALRTRLDRLRAQGDSIAARHHAAQAGLAAAAASEALDPLTLGDVLDRLEDALLDEQARAAAQAELASRVPAPAPPQDTRATKDTTQR